MFRYMLILNVIIFSAFNTPDFLQDAISFNPLRGKAGLELVPPRLGCLHKRRLSVGYSSFPGRTPS